MWTYKYLSSNSDLMEQSIRRKIQRTGGSSFSVTLPKNWSEKMKLKPGMEIVMSPDQTGGLLIHPPESRQDQLKVNEKLIEIAIERGDFFVQQIIAAYLLGYNSLRLHSKEILSSKEIRLVEDVIKNFIGLEIIESDSHTIVIQDLSSASSIDIFRFMKRINKSVQRMLGETLDGFLQENPEKLQSVILEEPNVDKLYYMISRQLRGRAFNLAGATTLPLNTLIDYERVIKRLEGIADHCNKLAKLGTHIFDTTGGELKSDFDFSEDAEVLIQMFRDTMKVFFARDPKKASELVQKSHSMRESLWNRIYEISTGRPSPITFNLLRLFERINNYIADIGEATINITSSTSI